MRASRRSAIVAVGFWVVSRPELQVAAARQASWIFAASQALVVLRPDPVRVRQVGANVALAILAVAALFFLFTEREYPASSRRQPTLRERAYTRAAVGRSQVVRQRVLVPRSQVRILAPQPSILA